MSTPPRPNSALDTRCPRCGGPFHCGADEAHCDCFDLHLSATLRQQLAAQYSSCLCIACLKSLAQTENGSPA